MRIGPILFALVIPGAVAGGLLGAQESVVAGRAVESDATIRVFSRRGTIRVTSWTRDSVAVHGRVDAAAGRFRLDGNRAVIKAGIEPPAGAAADGIADLDIHVPARARLWIETDGAEIEVSAGGGTVDIRGGSGRVRVAGRAERVKAETLDGNVELALEAGLGDVRTASGTIVVRGLIRDLTASTVSGPLLVGMEGPVAHARLETASSEIAFKGDLEPDGRLDAETHGGDIELRLSAHLGAEVRLVSYGGGVVNQLVPTHVMERGPGKGEWRLRMGDGRAVVNVRTFKGTVTLKLKGEK